MVKHIILWTLKETDADKKAEILANMKEHLEGLAGMCLDFFRCM